MLSITGLYLGFLFGDGRGGGGLEFAKTSGKHPKDLFRYTFFYFCASQTKPWRWGSNQAFPWILSLEIASAFVSVQIQDFAKYPFYR